MSQLTIGIFVAISIVIGFLCARNASDKAEFDFTSFAIIAIIVFLILYCIVGGLINATTNVKSQCLPTGQKTTIYSIPDSIQLKNKLESKLYTSSTGYDLQEEKYDPSKRIIEQSIDGTAYIEIWKYELAPENANRFISSTHDICQWHYVVPDTSYYRITN